MKKIFLYVALCTAPTLIAATDMTTPAPTFEPSQITDQVKPANSNPKNPELSKYLYLRNQLNAGFSNNQWTLHYGIEGAKIILSVGLGLLMAIAPEHVNLDSVNALCEADAGRAIRSAFGTIAAYKLVLNNLVASRISSAPNVTLLENLIHNWHMHKSHIPTEFHASFNGLSDYYERSKKTFSITEPEARTIISNLLTTCEHQINGLKIPTDDPSAPFNILSFFKADSDASPVQNSNAKGSLFSCSKK